MRIIVQIVVQLALMWMIRQHVPSDAQIAFLPLLPLILAGGSFLGGALSNKKSARTQTSTPTTPPAYQGLESLLKERALSRVGNPNLDLSGFTASGIGGINDVYAGIRQSSENNLTSRGLASSPVAGAVGTNIDLARGGDITQFLNSVPLLQRQFENQDFTQGLGLLQSARGQQTVLPGSAIGSGFGSAAELLAFLKGRGAF